MIDCTVLAHDTFIEWFDNNLCVPSQIENLRLLNVYKKKVSFPFNFTDVWYCFLTHKMMLLTTFLRWDAFKLNNQIYRNETVSQCDDSRHNLNGHLLLFLDEQRRFDTREPCLIQYIFIKLIQLIEFYKKNITFIADACLLIQSVTGGGGGGG